MNGTIRPSRKTGRRAAALLVLAVVLLSAPVAWALGELDQKAGTAGCVSQTGTGGSCQDGIALDGAQGLAASPDGRNVYVASLESDAVALFDRDPETGALTQKPGTAGCISDDGSGGACQDGTALRGARTVAASADGKNVYATFGVSNAVAVFDRDPETGALTQKPGTAGCISEDGSGGVCQNGTALSGAHRVAVSADGENVYVTSTGSDAVAVFDRDPATGALTQKAGTAGCISDDGSGGACQNGTALRTPADVQLSPRGENVYVASATSGAVAIFDRDPATGALAQKRGTQRCVSEDGSGGACEDGTALQGAIGVAASADGRSVYVASDVSDAMAVFDRDPVTGALTQKPGSAGCISETGTSGCRDGIALHFAYDVATSPDGESVYVASFSGAVVVFDRDPTTGALSQKSGTAGCVSEMGNGGACQDGTALEGAASVAPSPDGSSLYVASDVSDAVAVLDRATTSSAPPTTAPVPIAPPAPPRDTVPRPASPPPRDTLAPTVTRFAFSPSRFRVARAATPTAARAAARRLPPRGSRLRFTVSETADVRILIEHARAGRRVGKRCQAPTRRLRKRPRCTRYQRAGTLTRHGIAAGANTIPFSGRIGTRAVPPGRYRATITATDPTGNRSDAKRASYTIARR